MSFFCLTLLLSSPHSLKIRDVKPQESRLRPKGLGLGADHSAVYDLETSGSRRPPKPGQEPSKSEDEPLGLVTGSAVFIEAGPHKELYGKVRPSSL